MLLLFFVLTFLCPSSNKILIKEAKTSPIMQGNVAMTFYIVVENVSNCTYSISTKMTKCCENISKNDKDCKSMNLIGGEMGYLPPSITRRFFLLYPNMYLHNRKGQCTIMVKAVSLKDKKELTVNTKINFNTHKGKKRCKSTDLDPYQNCNPVDCTMKYLGTRNFFNSRKKSCQTVPTCLTNPSKALPDIVYVPRSNVCRNLDKCIEAKDLKRLLDAKNKPVNSFTTNIRCHQGSLDRDSGFCKCKPGWTSVPMNKDLFEPSLFQFHMCNMRVSSWNDVNNKKIKFTLVLIAIFGVIVSIFIILLSLLLSIVYRCLKSDQQPITISGDGTGSRTTITTPTSSRSSSRHPSTGSRSSQSKRSSTKSSHSCQVTDGTTPSIPEEKPLELKNSTKIPCQKNPCPCNQKMNLSTSDEDLSFASSSTTWSKYKWMLDGKPCSPRTCPFRKPIRKRSAKSKTKTSKRKCQSKRNSHAQRCSPSSSSIQRNRSTSKESQKYHSNRSTSLYIVNEIKKDQTTPSASLECTKTSSSEKQPSQVVNSNSKNQNILEIINKLIEDATPNCTVDRHYCSEPLYSLPNTDVTWGSSLESRSVHNNRALTPGKPSSTSASGKRPNFHLMEMIELQMSSEYEEDKIAENKSSELRPIVDTLNITRPQDFSTSETSNFSTLEDFRQISPSSNLTDESTQKKRPRIRFFRRKKYSKISTSSTFSSQNVSPKKSASKNLPESIPLCSIRRSLSSSEDTEDPNKTTKTKKATRFFGLKTKFRKYFHTYGKDKAPNPVKTSSWTSIGETLSSNSHGTSHEQTQNESPIRKRKLTNIPIPISSPLRKRSSSRDSQNVSPKSSKIPGPIFSRHSPRQHKSSSPGPSSCFYVDTDQIKDTIVKNKPP